VRPFVFFAGGGSKQGRPEGFSVGLFFLPIFMKQGDADEDEKLSRAEFADLAQKWFQSWDEKQTGKLGLDQIRAGLNSANNAPDPRKSTRQNTMLQGAEGKRNGLASAMGLEFSYVHADLEFEGRVFNDVGLRYKGNGTFLESRSTLKRSLKIDLNKYVKGQKLGDVTTLTLQNNVTDASWMNEVLAYRLYRDAGVPAPRTAFARLYVSVPGKFDRKYFGLYSLSEDVDKHFAERQFGTKGGGIFKPVTSSLFTYLGPDWQQYKQTYDPKLDIGEEQKKKLIDLCRLVTEGDDAEFAARIGQYLDLPEFARFMAVMVWLSDVDGILGPGQNLFLHLHPKTGLIEFIPWDQDHSFGQFPRGTQEQQAKMNIHSPWLGENRFLERMYQLESFKKLYLARLEEYSGTIFKPERFTNQVNEVAAAIRPAVQEESKSKLARFDMVVEGKAPVAGGLSFFGPPGMKPIKPFAAVRTQSICDQLAGRSKGLFVGGFEPPRAKPKESETAARPGGFSRVMLFAEPLLKALDEDKDSTVTRDEFTRGFVRFFDAWNTDHSGFLTQEQLRLGIDQDLNPFPPGGAPGAGTAPGSTQSPRAQ
jgi:hypothetical protein